MTKKYFASIAKVNHEHTEFVINKGIKDGVNKDQKFLIVELGDDIVDPDTGENLGTLEIVKGRARVLHIQEKMTTLISDEYRTIPSKEEIRYEEENAPEKLINQNLFFNPLRYNLLHNRGLLSGKKNASIKTITESQQEIKPLNRAKIKDKVKILY